MGDRDLLRRAGHRVKENAREYVVTYIFLVLSIIFVAYSGRPMTDIFYQLMSRLTRNLFIVLALIIPIVAGMGINFAITIGAMAAQIGLLLVISWGVTGIGGLCSLRRLPYHWRQGLGS